MKTTLNIATGRAGRYGAGVSWRRMGGGVSWERSVEVSGCQPGPEAGRGGMSIVGEMRAVRPVMVYGETLKFVPKLYPRRWLAGTDSVR